MKPTEAEVLICKTLAGTNELDDETFEYYGDEFYPYARNCVPFFEKKVVKVDVAQLKKKDKIIKENTLRLIESKLSKVNFDMKNIVAPSIFSSKVLELRAICFMYVAQFYLTNKLADIHVPFSVIVSIQRFLHKVDQTLFSKMAFDDLQNFCSKLILMYGYDGKNLYEKTPELISASMYDVYVPAMSARPYEHQKDAMKLLEMEETVKSGFVCIYSTSTNSGKTFTSVGLASRIQKIASVTFLFVCEIKLVREKVKSLLLNCGIKSYLVCTADEAYNLLNSEGARTKYVLFIDEIALNSHFKSPTLLSHMKLFSVAPKWVYLSGANLNFTKLDFFHIVHSNRFENSKYVVISTNKIFSSVSAFTFDGQEVLPHMYCKTKDDLKEEMASILINQFKGRMYTPTTNSDMLNKAMKFISWSLSDDESKKTKEEEEEILFWKRKFPDMEKIFSDVSQLYPDNIRKIAMDILSTVVDFDDDYMVQFIAKPSLNGKKVDLMKLDYHLFPNINIVAHPQPEKFAKNMFQSLLQKLKTNIGSCDKLIHKYQSEMNAWKSKMEDLDKIKDEKKRVIEKDDLLLFAPKIAFPAEFQINTKEFCQKQGVTLKKYRHELDLECIDFDSIADKDLLLLLFMGVGVYSSTGTKSYTNTILKLVASGKLEFLITDVCYGFDYPFGALFITKEFSDEKSTTDIFQLMSRIGRGRMSHVGQVYMDKSCAEKISGRDDTTNTEIANMFDVLFKLIQE